MLFSKNQIECESEHIKYKVSWGVIQVNYQMDVPFIGEDDVSIHFLWF